MDGYKRVHGYKFTAGNGGLAAKADSNHDAPPSWARQPMNSDQRAENMMRFEDPSDTANQVPVLWPVGDNTAVVGLAIWLMEQHVVDRLFHLQNRFWKQAKAQGHSASSTTGRVAVGSMLKSAFPTAMLKLSAAVIST